MALGLIGEDSEGLLCRMCGLKGQERDGGQSKERDQKTEDCERGEEEEEVRVYPMTLE